MSREGMTGCDKPGYSVTAHVNNRNFGAHRGLKWTNGVNLAPDVYYDGCTPLVKEVADVEINGVTAKRAQYRKMKADERCFDVVMRCDSDQLAANVCRTLRSTVIISGEIFEDALINLPDGVDVKDIESSNPAVLSLRSKICSGLGRPTEEELTAWGL